MKKENRVLKFASKFAFPVLVLLVLTSVAAFLTITSSKQLVADGFPGAFATLYDYTLYPSSEHPAYALGQLLNNIIAYFFAASGLIIFVLALILVRHNGSLKAKTAFLALFLLIPATIGMTGGFIDFCGHGFKHLIFSGNSEYTLLAYLMVVVYTLDFLYYLFTIIYLAYAITAAVKVNRGEVEEKDDDTAAKEKELEEKLRQEEEEAEKRAALLKDIRMIVREELDRLDRVTIVKEIAVAAQPVQAQPQPQLEVKEEPKEEPKEEKPAPSPAPAPVEETKYEEPEEEEVEEEEEEPKEQNSGLEGFKSISAPRVPFAIKIVKADKETREKYNELKNEFLAYGASSRLSISGDTFRLHRKAYVKITLVGKTLKVYFALDPKEFEGSTIPVSDAGDKASYVEVPALLKVRSNLSVRRAKELGEMAFGKDGIEKEQEAQNHDYVKDLRAELKANKQ